MTFLGQGKKKMINLHFLKKPDIHGHAQWPGKQVTSLSRQAIDVLTGNHGFKYPERCIQCFLFLLYNSLFITKTYKYVTRYMSRVRRFQVLVIIANYCILLTISLCFSRYVHGIGYAFALKPKNIFRVFERFIKIFFQDNLNISLVFGY